MRDREWALMNIFLLISFVNSIAICRWSLFLSISCLVSWVVVTVMLVAVVCLLSVAGCCCCCWCCYVLFVFYCRLLSFRHCHFAFYSRNLICSSRFTSSCHSFVLFNKLLWMFYKWTCQSKQLPHSIVCVCVDFKLLYHRIAYIWMRNSRIYINNNWNSNCKQANTPTYSFNGKCCLR